jgi:hypothetical protein
MYWNPHLQTLFRDKEIGGSADVGRKGKQVLIAIALAL